MDRQVASDDADRDLERRVLGFLSTRHVPGLRNLQVEAHNGVVTVSGRVLTFYEKQLCNECCRRVAGVMQLVNSVNVADGSPVGASR